MIRKQVADPAKSSDPKTEATNPSVTLFTIPKPFQGHIGTIQKNAIRSWARMQPQVEILIFGQDDPELESLADEVGATLLPLKTNDNGTPLLSDAFGQVHRYRKGHAICYANSDMVFGSELLEVAGHLQQSELDTFVAIGQRTNLRVDREIDFECARTISDLFLRARESGKIASVVCKDFFLFPPTMFDAIPDFLVGRGNWDNWMVAHARSRKIPVVDVSGRLPAIHQDHDYNHVEGGRIKAYVSGDEARENQRLAGGRNLIMGSSADWILTKKGLRKLRFPVFRMIFDVPRFVRLLRNLLFLGYLVAGSALSI